VHIVSHAVFMRVRIYVTNRNLRLFIKPIEKVDFSHQLKILHFYAFS